MLIEADALRGILRSAGVELTPIEDERHAGKTPELALAEILSAYVQGLLPDGVPAYTMSELQARTVITLLAPGWSAHTVKLTAYEHCSPFAIYAPMFMSPKGQAEIAATRKALKSIEYVLWSLTGLIPAVDAKEFIQFGIDPDTKVMVPMFNPQRAILYQHRLTLEWENIPLRDEAPAKLS